MRITVLVGTQKGAFALRSDARRSRWTIEGPLFKGWKATAAARRGGRWLLALASDIYGPSIQSSPDLKKWTPLGGPAYSKSQGRKLDQIWRLGEHGGRLLAGVSEAGLFASEDGGRSWEGLPGLNEHPTRPAWIPGAGGLCAHAVLSDPRDSSRLWCGISAVGVFFSPDGGRRWEPRNRGVRPVLEDKVHKDVGYCVHGLAADPEQPGLLYRREHRGMYVSHDGGENWKAFDQGLPSDFGFPLVMDRRARTLYTVPLESDEYRLPKGGALAVYRRRHGAKSWEKLTKGLPGEHAYMGVLRGALAADSLDPCGLYLGDTSGGVHVSRDGGESWKTLPCVLQRILFVEAFVD